MNKELFRDCVEIAAKQLKGSNLDPESQVSNIFAYGATDQKFNSVISSEDPRVMAELKGQIKYISSLKIDTSKGKNLVYVKTRGLNIGTRQNKVWLTMPDIQESYHALILILIRSGSVKNVNVLHTYENYEIDYSGDVTEIPKVMSWKTKPQERGEYTGCFVVLTFPDGEIQTGFHHASDISRTHEAFTKSVATWKTHRQAMTAKSAILDQTRYVPAIDETVSSILDHYNNDTQSWGGQDNDFEIEEPKALPDCTEDYFIEKFGAWKDLVNNGVRTADEIVIAISTKFNLTEEQIRKIKEIENGNP